ncbi:hypothetical protein R6242_09615 [Iodobacter sp. CM08]|uniref:hypothetical protein n=1 Tax=Iodobacter sp. CM08 TaxID=3085902 RepID=UPI0029823B5B|nr:hypothetical protein [Iodobacter sp. CM08]MDW5416821.1 hypothetical protein [Iodobacter sp. CM08]
MNTLQRTALYGFIFITVLSILGAVLMLRKYTVGVDLIFNPVILLIAITLVVAMANLILNFKAIPSSPSAKIATRGMVVLVASCLSSGVGLPGIYLINSEITKVVVITLLVLTLAFMLIKTWLKARGIKEELLVVIKQKYSEKSAQELIDDNLSVMHNLPLFLSVMILALLLVGYNTIRAFPTFSGICLLFGAGFISLICYQFSFACWLVAGRINKLK